jgi:hypothetical protein
VVVKRVEEDVAVEEIMTIKISKLLVAPEHDGKAQTKRNRRP